jgi:predicted dehydrogenase
MIRWGIVGCGDVCEVKSGPAFARISDSSLSVVMRRDGDKARDYAQRHGVPRWTDDAAAVIEDPSVDAVYIATPPGSHAELAELTARAGKPCYVEKPMARHLPECERMIEAFARAKQPLFVAYYRRTLPRFVRAKSWIEEGRLGELTSVHVTYSAPRPKLSREVPLPWRLMAEHAGGGLFFDLASHTLDALDFLIGPITSATGRAVRRSRDYAVEDGVVMEFECGPGVVGAAVFDYAACVRHDSIVITGTAGTLTLATFGSATLRLETVHGQERIELPDPQHIQEPLVTSIVEELHGRGQCPSTGISAARTARWMDVVTANYYGGREDAFWSRPASWPGVNRGG